MNVQAYVRIPVEFGWGGVGCEDCTTWCATYARMITGEDPAADLRGTYSTEAKARALILSAGGLVPLVAPRLERIGWEPVAVPQNGDLAVIHAVSGFTDREPFMTEIAAMRFGPLWAVMSLAGPCGVAPSRVQHVIRCWRWPA